jgi:hypothetical protein
MNKSKMNNFLNKVANKSNTEFFPGVVIIGNCGSSTNTQVAVYSDGAILNNTPDKRVWPSDNRDWDCTDPSANIKARHYFIGEKVMFSKGEVCKMMGIKKLDSSEPGFKAYKNTPIGPVLYFTTDTDVTYWAACIKENMSDRHCKTYLKSNFGDDMAAFSDLKKEVA